MPFRIRRAKNGWLRPRILRVQLHRAARPPHSTTARA